jgi:hypothetical protein
MHESSRCFRCGRPSGLPVRCTCTKSELDKAYGDHNKEFENRFYGSEPSIERCKLILMANGYLVKKNPKRKKKRR